MTDYSMTISAGSLTATLIFAGLGFAFLTVLNLLTYSMFEADKQRAESGDIRISESTLLSLAFFGGSVGAKLAQRRFRHKTRKQPFRGLLNGIVVLHICVISALALVIASSATRAWIAIDFAEVLPV